MDQVHGVDVSWLHTPNKENQQRKPAPSPSTPHSDPKLPPPPPPHNGIHLLHHHRQPSHPPSPGPITPPSLSAPKQNSTPALPTPPTPPAARSQPPSSASRRPNILGRSTSTERVANEGKASRRPSWMSNISSKFSSAQIVPQSNLGAPSPLASVAASPPSVNGNTATGAQQGAVGGEAAEKAEPYVPSKPKDSSSFFSSLTRRLSSGSQMSVPRVQGTGGMCARRVLNVDPNRERCGVPELDANKLRRVSFCVDVEIAGGPRYRDEGDEGEGEERKRRRRVVKGAERGEGEALKHPEAVKEEKVQEEGGGGSKPLPVPGLVKEDSLNGEGDDKDGEGNSPPVGSLDSANGSSRKKEKKKRSEAERKERQQKKLRRAQENGSIPVEIMAADDEEGKNTAGAVPAPVGSAPKSPAPDATAPQKQDRPTTDPCRIYRRCCQLRETPILKRITEQLMSLKADGGGDPGVVGCLDLTGSRLQLADVVTLGDWLAVVPVKRLILEDADLNDEGVRVVLAGLLAAKRPEPTKRKSSSPKHRGGVPQTQKLHERAGIVEKITVKNNPRITRVGWKHISLFIYMCRSVKAIDLSMNILPDTMSISALSTPAKLSEKPAQDRSSDLDIADLLSKCLSERLGGSRLEELSLSECALTSTHIRKIIDGAIACGVSRLGLAGNHLTDESLEHVVRYIESGVCHGLDLGGNDLRGKLGSIASTFAAKQIPCWGLSLADCNLDTASVKPLFPALVKLPNFRFIDLSHNRDLCGEDNGTISLIRRYLPQMKDLKRIHLSDVGMNAKQAIKLAEVLPEGPRLAHVSITGNPALTALANATDEAGQEEACALYASLMVAVRVSGTLMYIDIDVPSADNNEIVKALAKQIVAYSLRNMEATALAEVTGEATANATATLTAPHGGEKGVKDLVVPDVIMQLIGHMDGSTQNADHDGPAPDDDYVIGGTGVVKALQYVLGDKANDRRRSSIPTTPTGALTPRGRPGSSAGLEQEGKAKAKQMSKDLLESARKIRFRLQPAIAKEASAGDEMAYRRLLFLDQTLGSMIQRFEEEYPETRVPGLPTETSALSNASGKEDVLFAPNTLTPIVSPGDDHDPDSDDETLRPNMFRHNSDASLASRALTLEEGRLHRLGQHLRREVVASSTSSPTKKSPHSSTTPAPTEAESSESKRLAALQQRLEGTSGEELKRAVDEVGWEATLGRIGASYEDLRTLQELDPEGWEQFREAHERSRLNVDGVGG